MCGIFGYIGKKNNELIDRMSDSLRHRGPDSNGRYSFENIHIGMVRLAIIDIDGGHQPMSNEEQTIHLIFNGAIYNYIELKNELLNKGHKFKTLSDTEVILHGYEEYGYAILTKLNGMFSIAILDSRERTLTLIRDRYGIKPLFYTRKPGPFVFGSEIKAILCHPDVSKDMDHEALSHYLSLRNIPAPFTIYTDVRELLPGQLLIVKENNIKLHYWYKIPVDITWQEKDEYVLIDEIDALLRDSVKLRLRSDVGYGAYLSGGIDSSTIVAMMSELACAPIKTFCLSFSDSPAHKKDSFYAKRISEFFSTEHHEYTMDWAELENELPTVIKHFDQPFAGVISSFWLSRFMANHVTVALSGDGADDMFGSYGHHRLIRPLETINKAKAQGLAITEILKQTDLGCFQDRRDFVLSLSNYAPWEWRLSYAAYMESEKIKLLSPKGKDVFGNHSTAGLLKSIYQQYGGDKDPLNNMLFLDCNTLLPNEILRFTDMLSMFSSIEVRTPFLDYRLVELAFSIPGSLKIRLDILKYIFRRVAARYLPKEITDRPKEGFVLPKNTWLRQGLRKMMHSTLSVDRLSLHGYFNQVYIDFIVDQFCRGDDSLTFKIWTLMVFQIWYEQNIG